MAGYCIMIIFWSVTEDLNNYHTIRSLFSHSNHCFIYVWSCHNRLYCFTFCTVDGTLGNTFVPFQQMRREGGCCATGPISGDGDQNPCFLVKDSTFFNGTSKNVKNEALIIQDWPIKGTFPFQNTFSKHHLFCTRSNLMNSNENN